jgi:hypothetical protein
MTQTVEPRRLNDLVRLMGVLERLHEGLLTLVQAKIDAMKRADMPAMSALKDREQAVVRQLREREGLRRQLVDWMGEEMGLPSREARAWSVSQLAARLSEPGRTKLLDAAGGLRQVISRVAQANRIAGAVSREILNHLGWVFASVRPVEGRPVGYSGRGAVVAASQTRIFEIVG